MYEDSELWFELRLFRVCGKGDFHCFELCPTENLNVTLNLGLPHRDRISFVEFSMLRLLTGFSAAMTSLFLRNISEENVTSLLFALSVVRVEIHFWVFKNLTRSARPEILHVVSNFEMLERADAQEQLGPPFVYVWVAFLRSLASTKELGAEHVAVLKQYWENTVLKSAPVQMVSHVRYCRAKPCRKVEGKEGWTRIVFCLDPITLPLEGALEAAIAAAERGEEIRPRAKRRPRTRSGEAPDADARGIERLARRVEQHSQRMAELLRRGVLEPSLAYAFLMTKGGQRIPQAKSKAKARASSRASTSEGAEAAPDTSPPRLPPERPPMVFTRGETMEPSNADPEVRTSRRA